MVEESTRGGVCLNRGVPTILGLKSPLMMLLSPRLTTSSQIQLSGSESQNYKIQSLKISFTFTNIYISSNHERGSWPSSMTSFKNHHTQVTVIKMIKSHSLTGTEIISQCHFSYEKVPNAHLNQQHYYINLSSGGGFITLSISTRGLQYSC